MMIAALAVFSFSLPAHASGPFGPPQPVADKTGGLHTAIGYWRQADQLNDHARSVIRQTQVYSEAGYGWSDRWDIYGRIGVSDMKVINAFSSASAATVTSKNDFHDHWGIFGTLGAKGFYPINRALGIGASVQGTYYFRDFADDMSGAQNGTPFSTELNVKDIWDVHLGIGIQGNLPYDLKVYAGPYVYYSQAKVSASPNIAVLRFASGPARVRNHSPLGGFAGMDVGLGKGFHLNIEGRYAARFSVGAAVTYSY
ncbi:MAG: hypothetical protein JW884_11095 [Deltaproteobacteria bacterium]|nr:hypothetical protein [Deltaproteobacteria bacterium]